MTLYIYTDTLKLYRHELLGPHLINVQYFRKFNSTDELISKIIKKILMIINKSLVLHTCLDIRSGKSYEVRYVYCLLLYVKYHALMNI